MKLPKEAMLLNTPSFIIKTALAMFFAFLIGRLIPIVNRDMISFLFGLVLTLEPVNITGYKRGFDQFVATLVGGIITGLIILVVGVNPLGLALSMALVIYYTLRKNWREMSVVAIFTTIYMTQFLQMTPHGQPDILMTFAVRVSALTAGIVFALIANFIASFIVSPNFVNHRIDFLKYRFDCHIDSIIKQLNINHTIKRNDYQSLALMFKDADWTLALLEDFAKDPIVKWRHINRDQIEMAIKKAEQLRTLSHYLSDIQLQLKDGQQICSHNEVKHLSSALIAVKNNQRLPKDALAPIQACQPRIYDSLMCMQANLAKQ